MRGIKAKTTKRYQSYSRGRKPTLKISLWPELREAVEQDAAHFHCSASFVVNTAIATIMGIDVGEKYYIEEEKKNGRKRVRHTGRDITKHINVMP